MNRRKPTDTCYRSVAYMEIMKHCCIAIGLLYLSKHEKIYQKIFKFIYQNSEVCDSSLRKQKTIWDCGSAKNYRKSTANLQICCCGPPIVILRNLRLRNRVYICGVQALLISYTDFT